MFFFSLIHLLQFSDYWFTKIMILWCFNISKSIFVMKPTWLKKKNKIVTKHTTGERLQDVMEFMIIWAKIGDKIPENT